MGKEAISNYFPIVPKLSLLLGLLILWQLNALLSNGQPQQQQQAAATSLDGRIGWPPRQRPACQLAAYSNNQAINQRRSHNNDNLNLNYFPPSLSDEIRVPIVNNDNSSLTRATPSLTTTISSSSSSSSTTATLATNNYENNQNKQAFPAPSSTSNNRNVNKPLDTSERLRQLRQLLVNNNYDGYLVTPNDEHGSEYVSDYDRRLKFISGFTGSNGYALILLDKAILFTDGRYTLQADQDLDCNWWLVVSEEPEMDIHLWLKGNLKNSAGGLKIATDARLMPLKTFDYLDEHLKKFKCEFALISQDLIDVVWNNAIDNNNLIGSEQQQPVRVASQDALFVHKMQFSGNVSWQEKVIKLSESMERLKAQHYVVSHLDDIAWLLNLRGNDIPMSPLFKAYLFISVGQTKQQQDSSSTLQQPVTLTNNNNNRINHPGTVEQLLLYQQQQQQQQQLGGGLHSPQVLQVQANKFIRITMYVDLKKITKSVREHLQLDSANGTMITTYYSNKQQPMTTRIQVDLKDYEVFIMDLRERLAFGGGSASLVPSSGTLNSDNSNNNSVLNQQQLEGKLLLDTNANVAIHVLAKTYENRLILTESLINKMKSIKTDGEVNGMRLAHWRDSLAISMLLAQLDFDIGVNKLTTKWTETSAANELEFYRSLMDYNKGQSFPSISAYGAQSAIVHYQPKPEDKRLIGNESTYLIDSGGQYLDGTTDITRTAHYGEPTNFQRETYTRVLMGAVDMMSLIFEQSHRSPFKLNDLLARRHLFDLGLNYQHGTGHGIGLYSLVHESPYLIEHYTTSGSASLKNTNNKRQVASTPPILSEPVLLQPNMFTSVEPGYYKANDFGIRLENIVVTQRLQQFPASLARQQDPSIPHSNEGGDNEKQFLRLEPISLVPFEPKLIKFELLSNKQKAWLNSYNLMVRLRMTQQINYYLAKIKNSQNAPLRALSISYQSGNGNFNRLFSNNNATNIAEQNGYYNFLAMPGDQLKEKLELTHKWIMSKTELIPLDVPQSLISPEKLNLKTSRHDNSVKSDSSLFINKMRTTANEEETPAPSSSDGQRLLLTYMSSLPFNDLEAAEAVAALQQSDLIGRAESDNNQQSNKSALGSQQLTSTTNKKTTSAAGNKCAGLECDLWLLKSMNSASYQQLVGNNNRQELNSKMATSNNQLPASWTETLIEPDERLIPSSLMDLFSLNGSSSPMSSMNILWSALFLGLLLIVSLTVMTYMCRSKARGLCSSGSSSSASRTITVANRDNSLQTINSTNTTLNAGFRRQLQLQTQQNQTSNQNFNVAQAAV